MSVLYVKVFIDTNNSLHKTTKFSSPELTLFDITPYKGERFPNIGPYNPH